MDALSEIVDQTYPGFKSIDRALSQHGLETPGALQLREKIKSFLETNFQATAKELGDNTFSVMVGGSLQAGTADNHSDVDLTLIFVQGDPGKIWSKGGTGETSEGIRGVFLFRPDSLKKQLVREVEVDLLSLSSVLQSLKNWGDPAVDKDWVTDDIVRIFSPQIYQTDPTAIERFRRLVISKLASMPDGEDIWDKRIAPGLRDALIARIGDEKGRDWPERAGRSLEESQQKEKLTKEITHRLESVEIPDFKKTRDLYAV